MNPVTPPDISWQSQQNFNNVEEGPLRLSYIILISLYTVHGQTRVLLAFLFLLLFDETFLNLYIASICT